MQKCDSCGAEGGEGFVVSVIGAYKFCRDCDEALSEIETGLQTASDLRDEAGDAAFDADREDP